MAAEPITPYIVKNCRISYEIPHTCIVLCIHPFLAVATLMGIIDDLRKDGNHSIRMADEKTRFVTSCDISVVIIIVFYSTITLPKRLKKLWTLLHHLNQVLRLTINYT